MILSERSGKWVMRFFPPLFFNRIWVKRFHKDFMGCSIVVRKSLLNRNMNGSIFGGTMFSAADPIYSVMYWQIFARKGIEVQSWLKSAEIHYYKPAETDLHLEFSLTEADVEEATRSLNNIGKFVKTYSVEMKNRSGDVCAVAHTEIYLRKLRDQQKALSGF